MNVNSGVEPTLWLEEVELGSTASERHPRTAIVQGKEQ